MNKHRLLATTLFILFVSCVNLQLSAQNNMMKAERRIYLWDVTLSMKGYQDKTPDIYSKVVNALVSDIETIKVEDTEIIVIPFQEGVLDVWSVKATNIGRQEIVKKIKSYKNDIVTSTDSASPLKDVMDKHINKDKRNILILLTDGVQKRGKESELYAQISKWCAFAERNDAYAFYVMLTKFAQNDELVSHINKACRFELVPPPAQGEPINIKFIDLLPQDKISYNIKDGGEELRVSIDCKKDISMPDDLKIEIISQQNPYITIDDICEIENGRIEFDIKLKQPIEELKQVLPIDEPERLSLILSIKDADKYPLVKLLRDIVTLELINKPEKILKIYVKD